MRNIKGIGVWPVAMVGGLLLERPLAGLDGRIKGWNTPWEPERPFPVGECDSRNLAYPQNTCNHYSVFHLLFDRYGGFCCQFVVDFEAPWVSFPRRCSCRVPGIHCVGNFKHTLLGFGSESKERLWGIYFEFIANLQRRVTHVFLLARFMFGTRGPKNPSWKWRQSWKNLPTMASKSDLHVLVSHVVIYSTNSHHAVNNIMRRLDPSETLGTCSERCRLQKCVSHFQFHPTECWHVKTCWLDLWAGAKGCPDTGQF